MTKGVAVVSLVLLVASSVLVGATEVGIRFGVGYNPNVTTTFRRVQLPLTVHVAAYGEFQSDRWTGSISVGSSLLQWALSLMLDASYAVTTQVDASAHLTVSRSGGFTFLGVGFGGMVALSDQPARLSVGSTPLSIGVLHFQDRWSTSVSALPALFIEADWRNVQETHFRERIDLVLTPLTSAMVQENLPPERMWEHVGLTISATTSVGVPIPQ